MKFNQSILSVALAMLMVPTVVSAETVYNKAKKLSDYLYDVVYFDYDYADYLAVAGKQEFPKVACSAVHNGQFYGRNCDFLYNEAPEFVVRVPPTQTRYASIGVAYLMGVDNITKMDEDKYTCLPWSMFDGINENGVAANINVCPANDLTTYIAPEGTKSGKEDLNVTAVVRYVLDNAKTAKHAVKLLGEKNIRNNTLKIFAGNKELSNYGFHFMIADAKSQYIVEWRENKMYCTGKEPVMTNFFNTLSEYTPHAQGVERYKLLKENYALGGKSMDGMDQLMRMVQYSKAYDLGANKWFSEFVGFSKALGYDVTLNQIQNDEDVRTTIWKEVDAIDYRRNGPGLWQTINTSIYDLKNLALRLYVQEDYDKHYDFKL